MKSCLTGYPCSANLAGSTILKILQVQATNKSTVREEIDLKTPEANFSALTPEERVFSFVMVWSSAEEKKNIGECNFPGCCHFVLDRGLKNAFLHRLLT